MCGWQGNMTDRIEQSPWVGRIDAEETKPAPRWHQVISPLDDSSPQGANVLLGFACDAGVERNKGRTGASEGPLAIRKALANLSYDVEKPLFDAGDVDCIDNQLERAQKSLADTIASLLHRQMKLVVLGGGHEIAWGSFQGIMQHLLQTAEQSPKVGIINFDAHLDLRNPVQGANSGTPFRQIAEWCSDNNHQFLYQVIGVSPSANTAALFDYARAKNVSWLEDVDVHIGNNQLMKTRLREFLRRVDYLYITICLDVLSAAIAPGVSAPAGVGISADVLINVLRTIHTISSELSIPIILTDVAEMNPRYDLDGRTARLAARLVWEICQK